MVMNGSSLRAMVPGVPHERFCRADLPCRTSAAIRSRLVVQRYDDLTA
jgi:hypothetical protein